MTERLYYHDSYLAEFRARVVDASPDRQRIYLDRTAFYPTSGGQPFDTGQLGGRTVVEVIDEGDRIAHVLSESLNGSEVEGRIDLSRRVDHMQQHTGQHVLSAVFEEWLGLHTVSFHLGAESSTIDLEGGAVDARTLVEAERRANEIVCENRPVSVQFESAAEARGLRKATAREGTLRIVSIEALDRSACGGTHVRSTGEIGAVLLRRIEKIRQSVRVEFLCGMRAVRRARADYEALARAAQLFSAPLDEVPAAVAAQAESTRAAEKARRKLELDLAVYRGRDLHDATPPAADGFRRVRRLLETGNLEELRALAQSFTALPKAVFVAALSQPPSVLLAVSADAGIDAGKTLKAALEKAGGRGGGSPRMAQGSVATAELLERVLDQL